MEQMDLFTTDWDSLPKESPKKVYSFSNKIKEKNIRTENQSQRKYAYDVGEKIAGSRKEEAKLALELWKMQNSVEGLEKIEGIDNKMAAEIITRDEIFSDFSLETEKENGVEPQVARLKQLIIQRIKKVPQDSKEARRFYYVGATWVKEQLNSASTWEEMKDVIYHIRKHTRFVTIDRIERTIKSLEDDIAFLLEDEERAKRNEDDIHTKRSILSKEKNNLETSKFAETLRLIDLGEKFASFFKWDAKSANQTIRTVFNNVDTWDDLLAKKSSPRKRKSNKPVWERQLPDNPERIGGVRSTVHSADDLMNTFKFRGVQFGNWTGDRHGSTHIFKSSEGFYDLADVLGMKSISSVSLNGTLGMAYGARGRGNAVAHYEPGQTVINITRNHLGSLGHEWGHAFDNFLYRYSHNFKNGQEKMLSELTNIGNNLPSIIELLYRELIGTFKEGRSVRYEAYQGERYTRISAKLVRLYKVNGSDILESMNELFELEERKIKSKLNLKRYSASTSTKKLEDKLIRMADKNLKLFAKVLACIHFDETGEKLEKVPVPTFTTAFFQTSLVLDRGAKGKYWSSNVELFARAFEAWLEDKLREQGRRNDYLVCGTRDPLAYPQGKEREKINKQFDLLFEQLREIELFKI